MSRRALTSTGHRHGPWLQIRDTRIEMPKRGHCSFIEMANPTAATDWDPARHVPGLLLFRAASGISGIMPVDITVLRNGASVASVSVLHHGDAISIAGVNAKFYEIERTTIEAASYLLKRTCNYCKSSFDLGHYAITCALCGEGYHEDCWAELHGHRCCSRNCSFSPGSVDFVTATEARDGRPRA